MNYELAKKLKEQVEKMRHGYGTGDGYWIDRGYNMAVDDFITLIESI